MLAFWLWSSSEPDESLPPGAPEWCRSGNLENATIHGWHMATHPARLATAGILLLKKPMQDAPIAPDNPRLKEAAEVLAQEISSVRANRNNREVRVREVYEALWELLAADSPADSTALIERYERNLFQRRASAWQQATFAERLVFSYKTLLLHEQEKARQGQPSRNQTAVRAATLEFEEELGFMLLQDHTDSMTIGETAVALLLLQEMQPPQPSSS